MSTGPITVNKGEPTECTLRVISITNVSIVFDFQSFHFTEDHSENLELVALLREFFRKTLSLVTLDVINNFGSARIKLSVKGNYSSAEKDYIELDKSTKEMPIYRHEGQRIKTVNYLINKIFAPEELSDNNEGSELKTLEKLEQINIQIITPIVFNANSLTTTLRLVPGTGINTMLHHLPYNKDKYCVLHCLYSWGVIKKMSTVVETQTDEYLKDFNTWVKNNKLDRFYFGNLFLMEKLDELEEQIGISINLHVLSDNNKIETYYRSICMQTSDPCDLIIIPMGKFHDKRTRKAAEQTNDPITAQLVKEQQSRHTVKQVMNVKQGHCAVLNRNVFKKKSDKFNHHRNVCPHCNKTTEVANHQVQCLEQLRGVSLRDRTKVFQEVSPYKVNKVFKNQFARWKVPFVTYDFETKLCPETNEHIPFSYAILYLNIFEPDKSQLVLKQNDDPKELIKTFIEDCKTITIHHHDEMQSVDEATNKPSCTYEECPWCEKPFTPELPAEYNHSHFVNDNLNKHLELHICSSCNKAAQIRNKSLKFFAINGSRYDQNLFLEQFLNDGEIVNHKFLAKTDSRFTQVDLGFAKCEEDLSHDKFGFPIGKYKICFADSLMILPGSLASQCAAWIDKNRDGELLRTLLKLFYKDFSTEQIDTLAEQSFRKQAFPYTALGNPEMMKSTQEIPREHFHNTFMNRECDDQTYKDYQEANKVLKGVVGESSDYTFMNYHDYYLLLDVVLLAIILNGFSNTAGELTGLNPLAFVSSSSFSWESMLKYNGEKNLPIMKIPPVDISRQVQRSIKGGFTQVFRRRFTPGKNDAVLGNDFTSLYPSVMAQKELPIEFVEDRTIEEGVSPQDALATCDPEMYHFIEVDIAPLAPEFQAMASMYPMFPETQTIAAECYSPDQKERYLMNNGNTHETLMKDQHLNTVSFYGKKNYVTSLTYLDMAQKVGYEVTKVHRVTSFTKGFAMKDFVEYMYTLKRDGSRDARAMTPGSSEHSAKKTQVALYKVILNSLYGQTIINSNEHKVAELLDIESQGELIHKRISSPRYISHITLGNKVVVASQKPTYTIDYLYAVGAAILWESKLYMARFVFNLYDWFQEFNKINHKKRHLELVPLMTDTDSFYYGVRNFKRWWGSYAEFITEYNKECYQVFDTSCCPEEYQDPSTHDTLGMLTNEGFEASGGVTDFFDDFVACAAKCYSYKISKKESSKGKGISKALAKELFSFELYASVVNGSIFEGGYKAEDYTAHFNDFKTAKFGVTTVPMSKSFVTLVDLKSYAATNGEECLIFGSEKHLQALAQ